MPKESLLYRVAAGVIICIGGGVGIFLMYRYLCPVLLPFALAWLLSLLIRPVVDRLAGSKKLLRGLVTAVLTLLLTGGLIFGIVKGSQQALTELGRLMEGISDKNSQEGVFVTLSGWITSISEHLPFPDRFQSHPAFESFCAFLDTVVRDGAKSVLVVLGERIPTLVVSVVGRLPSVLIFMTSLWLSCYYMSAGLLSPGKAFIQVLPAAWQGKALGWSEKLKKAFRCYFRAYLLLGLITFTEMLLGLSFLRLPYAFLMAGVIALVDFLPLLGAGAVLLPWALFCFVTDQGSLATGLLVIWGVHTLLRQIWEPRLIGRGLGLSPLTSLVAVYAGWRLAGMWGMLFSPLVAMVIKESLGAREATEKEKS